MRNESVAILDIRSYELTFFLGSRGVNGTFVFYGSRTEKYEGCSKDGFLDETSFKEALFTAVNSVRQNYGGEITEIYVGVPASFVSVYTKGHTCSFPSKRKISSQDIDMLYESGLSELLKSGECIRRSAMYFTLGDNRKYFKAEDVYGCATTLLKGALCYYFLDENVYAFIKNAIEELGIENVRFIPTSLAQATYLLPEKKREGYAFLLDVGFLTTTVSVVYGGGIVHEETFDCGQGTVIVSLMQELGVEYETAEEILLATNVSGGNISKDVTWTSDRGDLSFPLQRINEIVKCALDVLCENVENFFGKYYKDKNMTALAVNPISITGEGIGGIGGASEHVANRLNRLTEIISPDLPYYDKPAFSSRIALLSTALSDKGKRRWINKFFKIFGGKKS